MSADALAPLRHRQTAAKVKSLERYYLWLADNADSRHWTRVGEADARRGIVHVSSWETHALGMDGSVSVAGLVSAELCGGMDSVIGMDIVAIGADCGPLRQFVTDKVAADGWHNYVNAWKHLPKAATEADEKAAADAFRAMADTEAEWSEDYEWARRCGVHTPAPRVGSAPPLVDGAAAMLRAAVRAARATAEEEKREGAIRDAQVLARCSARQRRARIAENKAIEDQRNARLAADKEAANLQALQRRVLGREAATMKQHMERIAGLQRDTLQDRAAADRAAEREAEYARRETAEREERRRRDHSEWEASKDEIERTRRSLGI